MFISQSPLVILLFFLTIFNINFTTSETIYEILGKNGLPMGLLPKGVSNFTFDKETGKFDVHLDQACNAKFEDEIHYDCDISGNLSFGHIGGLSGISAQDLFLWFPVKEIRVDIPSSGLIYFDVGVVSKQFSLSSFETPRECLASSVHPIEIIVSSTNVPRKLRIRKRDHQEHVMTVL
uniref:uncharacterized protein At5g01610-like n=1 Tax=Erigeron canadensis TaxID=72917 RepID=UPI001CB8DD9A|nr:uncharacterized protein At5g01610-like [Erigeron canadensis]